MKGCGEFVKRSEIIELISELGVCLLYDLLMYDLITSNKNCLLKNAKVQSPIIPFKLWGAEKVTPTKSSKTKFFFTPAPKSMTTNV